MTAWDRLAVELDAWAAAGQAAEFWWRDDDAIDVTPALDRLVALRSDLDIPLALAVIPAHARPALAGALKGQADIDILQHGYAHTSHRPAGEKKAELGADRDLWDIARELADGRGRMLELFESDGLSVMVPPWNRIDPAVADLLPGLGFHGLTTFNARVATEEPGDLTIVNTHVDIIDWVETRGYAGDDAVLIAAIDHLVAKRTGSADPAEATGVLTHHLAHDEACWVFIEKFGRLTASSPAVVWRRAVDLFPVPS
ncbi:MAG: hypothetical protein ACI9JL_004468 [Paracoccaceae bacterium]|jgi:hypothetical protein